MAKMIHVEVSIRADSNFKPADAKSIVQNQLAKLKNPVRDFVGTCIQQWGLGDHVASVRFYNGVTSVRSILFEQGSDRFVDEINADEWTVTENVQELAPRIYKFNNNEPDLNDDHLSTFSQHWLCPNEKFEKLWENLYLPTDIKTRLLDYVCSIYSLGNGFDDDELISLNKMILIYGATGTGKTSLCKALAHKAAIRLGAQFNYGVFIHLDLQGCVGFSVESGANTSKLQDTMSGLQELFDDQKSLAFVLIENIDTFTRRRSAGPPDALESSKSMQFIINHLDKLRRYRNVVVLTTSLAESQIDNTVVDRADLKCYIEYPSPPLIYKILAGSINEYIKNGYIQAPASLPRSANVKPESVLFEEVKTLQFIADASKGLSGRSLKKLAFLTKVRCESMANFEKSLLEFLKVMKKCLKLEIAQKEVLTHAVIRPAAMASPHSVSSSTCLETQLPSCSELPARVKAASCEPSTQRTVRRQYSHFSFDAFSDSGNNPASVKCPAVRAEETDTRVQINKTEIDELYSDNSQEKENKKELPLECSMSEPVPIDQSLPSVDKCNSEAEFSFAKISDQELMESSSTSESCTCELNPVSSHESSEAVLSAESSSQTATEGENSDFEQSLKQKHLIRECAIDLSDCTVPEELRKRLTEGSYPFVSASEFESTSKKQKGRIRKSRTTSGSTSTSGSSVKEGVAASERSSPPLSSSSKHSGPVKQFNPVDVQVEDLVDVRVKKEDESADAATNAENYTGVIPIPVDMKLTVGQPNTQSYVYIPLLTTGVVPTKVSSGSNSAAVDRSKILRVPPKTLKAGCHGVNSQPMNVDAASDKTSLQSAKLQTRDATVKSKRKLNVKLQPDIEPEVINLEDEEDQVMPLLTVQQVYDAVIVQEGGVVTNMNGKATKKVMYHCDYCTFTFFFKRELNIHVREVHKDAQKQKERTLKYKCSFCSKLLVTFEGFKKHENSCREKAEAKGLSADKNGRRSQGSGVESFPRGETLTNGYSPERKRGRFECRQCDKIMFSKDEFSRHMTFHQEERPFKCSHCDKTYKTEKSLKFHADREHSPNKAQLNQIHSPQPTQDFPFEDNLQDPSSCSVTQRPSPFVISLPAYSPQIPLAVSEHVELVPAGAVTHFIDPSDENHHNQHQLYSSSDEKDFPGDTDYPTCHICHDVFVCAQDLEQHVDVHNNLPTSNDTDLENEFFREQRLENEVVPEAAHCVDIETTDDYLSLLTLADVVGNF